MKFPLKSHDPIDVDYKIIAHFRMGFELSPKRALPEFSNHPPHSQHLDIKLQIPVQLKT
jgi:hypothetical protein